MYQEVSVQAKELEIYAIEKKLNLQQAAAELGGHFPTHAREHSRGRPPTPWPPPPAQPTPPTGAAVGRCTPPYQNEAPLCTHSVLIIASSAGYAPVDERWLKKKEAEEEAAAKEAGKAK